MQPGGVYPGAPPAPDDPVSQLSASARGWHSIQMAVLGFIGICGVLRSGSGAGPSWVQWCAALLAVTALILACAALVTVGQVAYPFYGAVPAGQPNHQWLTQANGKLRTGIRLTFAALVLIVIAALSGWWPSNAAEPPVQVRDASGRVWCGPLAEAPDGALGVRTAEGVVALPLRTVAEVRPSATC